MIFILIDSYSENSGRPAVRSSENSRSTSPMENNNFRFILIDSYSENSGPGGSSGRSTPLENENLRFILIDSYPENSGR